jgi:hypothetical protein
MTPSSEVSVSISGDLLSRLRVRAAELEVPVKWLVVGLVCDTVEHMAHGCVAPGRGFQSHQTASHGT